MTEHTPLERIDRRIEAKAEALDRNTAALKDGPTLRDQFAMAAMQGLLAGRGGPIQIDLIQADCELAYTHADAMLEARK